MVAVIRKGEIYNRKGINPMNPKTCVACINFPCQDVKHSSYIVPDIELDTEKVSIMMISEAAPQEPGDHYYAGPQALFALTTLQVFEEAGVKANSIQAL